MNEQIKKIEMMKSALNQLVVQGANNCAVIAFLASKMDELINDLAAKDETAKIE